MVGIVIGANHETYLFSLFARSQLSICKEIPTWFTTM